MSRNNDGIELNKLTITKKKQPISVKVVFRCSGQKEKKKREMVMCGRRSQEECGMSQNKLYQCCSNVFCLVP